MAKICVITGGTSGIGKCTAEAMAQKGYTVYELSRRAEVPHSDRRYGPRRMPTRH